MSLPDDLRHATELLKSEKEWVRNRIPAILAAADRIEELETENERLRKTVDYWLQDPPPEDDGDMHHISGREDGAS